MTAPRRIWVVEDDRVWREALGTMLAAQGFVVDACRGGDEALALLRSPDRAPAMVLVDLDMLDVSGWGLIELIRDHDTLRDVRIAVLSDGDQAGNLVGVTVLPKPLRWTDLLAWCHGLAE